MQGQPEFRAQHQKFFGYIKRKLLYCIKVKVTKKDFLTIKAFPPYVINQIIARAVSTVQV